MLSFNYQTRQKLSNYDLQYDLIKRCKSGNRKAQYQLYCQYAKGMYNVTYRIVNNEQDAEDVLQNSFVDVFTKLHQYKFDSTPGAWIKRIVVNNSINHLRKNRLKFDELGENDVVDQPAVKEKSSLTYDVNRVYNAIESLPEGYRIVLSLYLMEGYDHNEIAKILDISQNTSKSQYSRAKKKLKQILAENESGKKQQLA